MDLKQQMMERAMKLMQDPRVMKTLQNPKVLQGLMGAMALRARVQQNVDASVRAMAKNLNLATGAEVRELRRTIDRLERQLARQDAAAGRDAGGVQE